MYFKVSMYVCLCMIFRLIFFAVVLGWEIKKICAMDVKDSRTHSFGSGGEKRSQSPYVWERSCEVVRDTRIQM